MIVACFFILVAEGDILVVLLERVIASVEAIQLTMMGIMGNVTCTAENTTSDTWVSDLV